MTIKIDRNKAIELLEKALEEKGPDYVYERIDGGCVYVSNGQPSCIVGHALAYAGVPIETISTFDEAGKGDGPYSWVDGSSINDLAVHNEYAYEEVVQEHEKTVLEANDIELDDEAITVFKVAQTNQDYLTSWGESVERAKAAV